MTHERFRVCASAALGLACFLSLAAVAPSAAVTDPRGDGPKAIDIVRVTAKSGPQGVTARIWLRKTPTRTDTTFQVALEQLYRSNDARPEDHVEVWFEGGSARARMWYVRETAVEHEPCSAPTVKVRKAENMLRVRVPKDCLSGNNPMRAFAGSTLWDRPFTQENYYYEYWDDDREVEATDEVKGFNVSGAR